MDPEGNSERRLRPRALSLVGCRRISGPTERKEEPASLRSDHDGPIELITIAGIRRTVVRQLENIAAPFCSRAQIESSAEGGLDFADTILGQKDREINEMWGYAAVRLHVTGRRSPACRREVRNPTCGP